MFLLITLFHVIWGVSGHGRLLSPPGRSTMWRYGYETPVNYDDNQLYCGGFGRQWNKNGGKCGICGDPWDEEPPRENELGGVYGKGTIVEKYKRGQIIQALVQLTANHRGYFEFRVCPVRPGQVANQTCLDEHLLKVINGNGGKYKVRSQKIGNYTVFLRLPRSLVCDRCVFQWHYKAGNNWGRCEDGSNGIGCGPQETFRSCADIAILP